MAMAKTINFFSSKLEGCHCHAEIWTDVKTNFKARVKRVQQTTRRPWCAWKGRQGPWFVAEGIAELLTSVRHSTSEELDTKIAESVGPRKLQLLQWVSQLRAKMAEILAAKLAFWQEAPWSLLGVFWCVLGGSVATSKAILRKAIETYDAAVGVGEEVKLHRVARRLLSKGVMCGRELRQWLTDEASILRGYTAAYTGLLEYALVSLVERRIESVHAILN